MLFREQWEEERCIYFSSLITYRASGMCEMNLWLKHLNKHIPPYRDGLATVMISSQGNVCVSVCDCVCERALLFSPTVSFINNWAFMWTYFTTIHLTLMLINTPRKLTGATGFHIKHTSRTTTRGKLYNIQGMTFGNMQLIFFCLQGAAPHKNEQSGATQGRCMCWYVKKKEDFLCFAQTQEKKEGDKHMQMRMDALDHTRSKIWEVSIVCKTEPENNGAGGNANSCKDTHRFC